MSPEPEGFRLSGVLSALSFALDLVEGQPDGHTVRSCVIGMKVAARLGLDADRRSALFYALLLKDAGASSTASKMSAFSGAPDAEAKRKIDQRTLRDLVRVRCERGAEISRLIRLPEATARAIRSLDEHWDGGGHPDGLKNEQIPLLARICGLARTVEVCFTAHGPAAAQEVARTRGGRWFDPELVDVLLAGAREEGLWEALSRGDASREVARLEPADRVLAATPERVDLVARAFGEIIDAKSPYTHSHSEGVARKAVAIGERAGLGPGVLRDLTRAGLLHDIGKLGVSSRILDRPGGLTTEEYARIQTHPRLTHEILSRVGPFRPIAEAAANHHERLDGSGYHRGLTAEDLDLPSRIVAVADVYDALSTDRPYQKSLPKEKALDVLREASGTKLDPGSIAILEDLVSE